MKQFLLLIFLLLTFLAGLYCTVCFNTYFDETMSNQNEAVDNSCPNLLIQKGNSILLYNTNQKLEQNKNPLPFFNLDEYISYLEIQKNNGIVCPVLFLQQETTTQGNDVYRVRPSPLDLNAGGQTVPVSQINTSNINLYPGFDPYGQTQGKRSILDDIHDSTSLSKDSDNPMDFNWGGVQYTQQMINKGKYKENEITRPSFFNPKVSFNPKIKGILPPPKDIL